MADRILWIGTSWKMTKTLGEARLYATALANAECPEGVQPFVLPANTALAAVRDCMSTATPVLIGAQNAHWGPEGAGTGEISMRMAADAGARIIEMGHSERREQFGETDETVALKARAAVDQGLIPLICVGESADVRDAGGAENFVTAQVTAALSRLDDDEVQFTLIAYEPVWAIGTGGRPATRSEVTPVMAAIRREIAHRRHGARCRALLYGGSVHSDNAAELLADPHTDGLFVGRAAWEVEGFLDLLAVGRAYLDSMSG